MSSSLLNACLWIKKEGWTKERTHEGDQGPLDVSSGGRFEGQCSSWWQISSYRRVKRRNWPSWAATSTALREKGYSENHLLATNSTGRNRKSNSSAAMESSQVCGSWHDSQTLLWTLALRFLIPTAFCSLRILPFSWASSSCLCIIFSRLSLSARSFFIWLSNTYEKQKQRKLVFWAATLSREG